MFNKVMKKVFGSRNERELKKMNPLVDSINALEPKMQALSDDGFKELTESFKERVKNGESLDDILPEAFAAAREVAKRKMNMRHFDVQLIGGYVLHQGKISEMKTGEGKTLVATLALYLNALEGKGAHLVTVNDYLARRDARWMGPVYHALGLSVATIGHETSLIYDPEYPGTDKDTYQLRSITRQDAYRADITYGTNNEFGFDYLRDNMRFSLEEFVQRPLHFAIVDEVDSILIDEARTPLIISGPTEDSTEKYYQIDVIIPKLENETHYSVDEKAKQVLLTEEGIIKVEELLNIDNLYDPKNLEALHHVNQALKAHVLFELDVDYVVNDGKVVIVDEFTGRLMTGRRWGDGLHQAVEAKEMVQIESENQTLATITFQNFFRMYEKLAGMTGTADTEAGEFMNIYKLEVVVIPTNKPMARIDANDHIYKSEDEKYKAVVRDIKEWHEEGRPILIGTISIENSEKVGIYLKEAGVPHEILNAKNHGREAEIISQAGSIGAVTIATNMAGRGTDIVLGGNPAAMAAAMAGVDDTTDAYKAAFADFKASCDKNKAKVLELGGLHIVGTERHDSRRIDNQLRGRAGRQGDPGASRFYVALDDNLMRIFASDRIASLMGKLGMEEGVPIEHGLVSKAIEGAQKKVEAHNFDIRKHLLEYDDVMNQQREVVYRYRCQIIGAAALDDLVGEFSSAVVEDFVMIHIDEKGQPDDWDLAPLNEALQVKMGIEVVASDLEGVKTREELVEKLSEKAVKFFAAKVETIGKELFHDFERVMMLHTLDTLWKDHLLSMDHLKSGIGLRGYGQKNPLNEYKQEGFELFSEMIFRMKSEVTERLFKVQFREYDESEEGHDHEGHDHDHDHDGHDHEEDKKGKHYHPAPTLAPPRKEQEIMLNRGQEAEAKSEAAAKIKAAPMERGERKVGRNQPCPCGSGKKYKKCCGQ